MKAGRKEMNRMNFSRKDQRPLNLNATFNLENTNFSKIFKDRLIKYILMETDFY